MYLLTYLIGLLDLQNLLQEPVYRVIIGSGIAVVVAILLRLVFFKLVKYYSTKEDATVVKALQRRLNNAIFLFIPFIALRVILDVEFPDSANTLKNLADIAIVTSLAVLSVKFIYVFQDVLFDKYDINSEDNMKARKVRTQIIFIRKIGIVIIAIVAVATILLTFDSVRKYGATLLTSAGVAGIIIGFAAQKTLSNLLAGIQIAFTQPIRIDDAVVVEGEWGWIEEINLTYVVVKIWDLRRLVLPITYFTETPFQNWTKNSSQILGAVILYMDYTLPIEKVRSAFEDIIEKAPLWDRQMKGLQVVDTTETTMKIRILMSAKNSPEAWDLRCHVREEMIDFIQKNYPQSLPTFRAELKEN